MVLLKASTHMCEDEKLQAYHRSQSEHVSGAENGAEWAENRVQRSGERALQKNVGAERSAEREVTERGAEVTEIGWSVERLFRPLRSAHMLCSQS